MRLLERQGGEVTPLDHFLTGCDVEPIAWTLYGIGLGLLGVVLVWGCRRWVRIERVGSDWSQDHIHEGGRL